MFGVVPDRFRNRPGIVMGQDSIHELVGRIKAWNDEIEKSANSNLNRFDEMGKDLCKLKEKCIQEEKSFDQERGKTKVSSQRASEAMRFSQLPSDIRSKCKSIRDAKNYLQSLSTSPTGGDDGHDKEEIEEESPPSPSRNGAPHRNGTATKPTGVNDIGKRTTTRKPPEPRIELKDRVGNVLPDSCRDAFADSSLSEMIAKLEQVELDLEADSWVKKAGKLTAHYPFLLITKFDEHAFEALHRVQVALEALRAAVPYAICKKCKGIETSGCKTCRGCGHLPEWKYKELAGEAV